MKIVNNSYSMLDELGNGRARGFAEVRRIVNAIQPASQMMHSATLLEGLSVSCYRLSIASDAAHHLESVAQVADDYTTGRSEILQEASDIAWAISTVADRLEIHDALGTFLEIVRRLD